MKDFKTQFHIFSYLFSYFQLVFLAHVHNNNCVVFVHAIFSHFCSIISFVLFSCWCRSGNNKLALNLATAKCQRNTDWNLSPTLNGNVKEQACFQFSFQTELHVVVAGPPAVMVHHYSKSLHSGASVFVCCVPYGSYGPQENYPGKNHSMK
jgi:heme A synthase